VLRGHSSSLTVSATEKKSIVDRSQRMNKKSDYMGKLDFISSSDVELKLGNSGFLKVFKSSGML